MTRIDVLLANEHQRKELIQHMFHYILQKVVALIRNIKGMAEYMIFMYVLSMCVCSRELYEQK